SWGSAHVVVAKAMTSSPKEIAVLGCGALGLTAAITAQQAGAQVTIHAREMLPDTRSARATGTWSPTSRIALESKVAPGFPALWEEMARTSWKTYRRYLGLPGTPVEWRDRYALFDAGHGPPHFSGGLDFADYTDRIHDITPMSEDVPPDATSFPVATVRRNSLLQFNIADYAHTLMSDFMAAGGRFAHAEFHS